MPPAVASGRPDCSKGVKRPSHDSLCTFALRREQLHLDELVRIAKIDADPVEDQPVRTHRLDCTALAQALDASGKTRGSCAPAQAEHNAEQPTRAALSGLSASAPVNRPIQSRVRRAQQGPTRVAHPNPPTLSSLASSGCGLPSGAYPPACGQPGRVQMSTESASARLPFPQVRDSLYLSPVLSECRSVEQCRSSVGAVSRQCREQCRLTLCRSVEECRGLCRVCVEAVSMPLDRSHQPIMSMCVGVSECRSVGVSVCRSVCRKECRRECRCAHL